MDKDTSVIPKDTPYCYKFNGKNWVDDDGMPHMGVDLCPYWGDKEIGGTHICWCSFLEAGGTYNDDRTDWDKLIEFFGSEEAAFDSDDTSLFLLFDQCKECGENYPDEED